MARQIRLASGLVLFAYVLTHLLNHSIGFQSLQAAQAVGDWFIGFWRFPVATVVLYGALAAHLALALVAIVERERLFLIPPWEFAQLLLGLAIVPLLAEHVIGTRLAYEFFNVQRGYYYVSLVLGVLVPEKGVGQAIVLVVTWAHGCIGLHFWLRLKRWYPPWTPVALSLAVLIPALALIGFVDMNREIARAVADPKVYERVLTATNFPPDAAVAAIGEWTEWIWATYLALLVGALLARALRLYLKKRRGIVRITYPGGRIVEVLPGTTILDGSRLNAIPHASVCGGRGRCSTCRVRVTAGLSDLPPASPEEQRVLQRVNAPPSVRLACQTRPTRAVSVIPLLPPSATARDGHGQPAHRQGQEKEIAILFADLREFTRLSEKKLPYDLVFILNRYFRTMGEAVESAGGHVDKFIGDGVMALFGVDTAAAPACRAALNAARRMSRSLAELNKTLEHEIDRPLRIGIGINVGPAIVGEMGYAGATTLTAIGDAVNTASRLESLTKEHGAELIIAHRVAELAGAEIAGGSREEITIRGRDEAMPIVIVASAQTLPELAEPARSAA